MPKTNKISSDSPLFIELITWIEKKNSRRLRAFFPLGSYSTWERMRGGKWKPVPPTYIRFAADGLKVVSRKSNLDRLRDGIRADLLEPLFVRQGFNVRYEPDCRRHKKDNAYCCVDFYRKRLKQISTNDLKETLCDFESDFKTAARGVQFPFWWILNDQNPVARELAELEKRMAQFENEKRRLVPILPAYELDLIIGKDEAIEAEKTDLLWASELARAMDERKRRYALNICSLLLTTMKAARGKPGRHPKEFNVLVYHVIKRCNHWKIDWKRRASGLDYYKYRKDGQHRRETDWKLVMFLLLDLHIHQHKLPEVAHFISHHKKEPAGKALKKMQVWLLNIRKNFPPFHGWYMNKEGFPEPETGFRKLIVTDAGGLKIISL